MDSCVNCVRVHLRARRLSDRTLSDIIFNHSIVCPNGPSANLEAMRLSVIGLRLTSACFHADTFASFRIAGNVEVPISFFAPSAFLKEQFARANSQRLDVIRNVI